MRVLTIFDVNLKTRGHIGVLNKTLSQARAISCHSTVVGMLCGDGSSIAFKTFKEGSESHTKAILNDVAPGTFYTRLLSYLLTDDKFLSEYDALFIRYAPQGNSSFFELVDFIHSKKLSIFVDMYTLEYRDEIDPNLLDSDDFYSKRLSGLVSAYFTPSNVSVRTTYLGRPIYQTPNGVSSSLDTSFSNLPAPKKNFSLIGVGYLARWHGYDRVLGGMRRFQIAYPEIQIGFCLVGEGPANRDLSDLALSLGVSDSVNFVGSQPPSLLANFYQNSHVAIGSIACHRIGLEYSEPLKHREYMMAGVPFIVGVSDSFTSKGLAGVMKVRQQDSALDLVSVYDWYTGLNLSEARSELKSYAKKNFTWERIAERIVAIMKASTPAQ